jgi:hypothetical protein
MLFNDVRMVVVFPGPEDLVLGENKRSWVAHLVLL